MLSPTIYFHRDLLSTRSTFTEIYFHREFGPGAARSTFIDIYFQCIYFYRVECKTQHSGIYALPIGSSLERQCPFRALLDRLALRSMKRRQAQIRDLQKDSGALSGSCARDLGLLSQTADSEPDADHSKNLDDLCPPPMSGLGLENWAEARNSNLGLDPECISAQKK